MLLVDSKSKQVVFKKRGEKSGDFRVNKFFEMHKLANLQGLWEGWRLSYAQALRKQQFPALIFLFFFGFFDQDWSW